MLACWSLLTAALSGVCAGQGGAGLVLAKWRWITLDIGRDVLRAPVRQACYLSCWLPPALPVSLALTPLY